MKMLFLVLLLLLNDKEGAHATQGKQKPCVDMPSFLIHHCANASSSPLWGQNLRPFLAE